MTSRTRDRGTERRAETAVFGRLFLQRMHQYRILAKDSWGIDSRPGAFLVYAGFLTGIVIARWLELGMVNFDPRSSNAVVKIRRYILSIGMVILTLLLLDKVFGAMADKFSMLGYFLQYVHYAVADIVSMFLARQLFLKIKMAEPCRLDDHIPLLLPSVNPDRRWGCRP